MNRFEDIESDEAQLKKLNKMVYGVTEWGEDRDRKSMHNDKRSFYMKSRAEKKRKQQLNETMKVKSPKSSLQQRKQLSYTSCDNKKFRKFYSPLGKGTAMNQLSTINSQYIKTSAKLNYPTALLNYNILSQPTEHFKQLKNKIKILQNKARNQYGLKFDDQAINKPRAKYAWADENYQKDEDQKENYDIDIDQLELGPILAKEHPDRFNNSNHSMQAYENFGCDTSIPKSLIEVVHNHRESFHQFNVGNNRLSSNFQKEKLSKKGYLYRPKTFKPTYTYIKI